MNLRKYLILAGVVIFGPCGDLLLSRGMKAIGAISFSNFHQLFGAVFNPWVATGICFLIVFFVSYLTALSWADLTYVLPASALGYVLIALLAHYCLHENVTVVRWLGILLITGGVGFVAGGPVVTTVVEDPSLQEVER